MRAERVVVGFDSATALLRDLSSHLSGARVPRPGERLLPSPLRWERAAQELVDADGSELSGSTR